MYLENCCGFGIRIVACAVNLEGHNDLVRNQLPDNADTVVLPVIITMRFHIVLQMLLVLFQMDSQDYIVTRQAQKS